MMRQRRKREALGKEIQPKRRIKTLRWKLFRGTANTLNTQLRQLKWLHTVGTSGRKLVIALIYSSSLHSVGVLQCFSQVSDGAC